MHLRLRKTGLLAIMLCLNFLGYAQSSRKPVFVIVHGAWGGAWAFKKIDSLLTEKGCIVYRPTLTGQGEKAHLASGMVDLKLHIIDVVNMILYEDLHDVILVGHSYGGMVITGVADSIPGRIKKMIYVDAFVPENGESVMDIWIKKRTWLTSLIRDSFLIPDWHKSTTPPGDVPQSLKTFTQRIVLNNPARQKIPTTYILTVAKGTAASEDDFASQAERARKKGWPVMQLEADHNPQWSATLPFAKMLERFRK